MIVPRPAFLQYLLSTLGVLPFLGVLSGPAAAVEAASPPVLIAHRAVYDLELSKTEDKGPTSAKGRIAFDFTGSVCEGYSQTFRQLTEIQNSDEPARVSDMKSATFEDGEGRNFRFKVDTEVEGGKSETVDGRAARPSGGGVSVSLNQPKLTKLDLAGDVIFPTEQMRRVIEQARAGDRLFDVKVYDGSDNGEKVFETTTVIGKPMKGEAKDASASVPALATTTRWPVTVSYFEQGKADSQPAYTLSFELYDNGISRELKLDYGQFALIGHMVKLELLPTKPCSK